jgi:hypothetical protein
MKTEMQRINHDTMESYEKRTGFVGLGKFLQDMGVVTLVNGGVTCKE